MEDGDHGNDQRKAPAGAELIPMGGDKQHHAAGQQHGSQNQRNQALPAQAGRALLLRLPGADAAGSLRIQDTGRQPAIQQRFKVSHSSWPSVKHIPASETQKSRLRRKVFTEGE